MTEPGEHKITPAEYQADPVEGGSLRASIAWLLVSQTPAHAWDASPRLNPQYVRKEKRHFDFGAMAHALLLGKGAEYEVINADDYRTKEARLVRDRLYRVGKTPILKHEFEEAQRMVASVRSQLTALHDYGTLEAVPFQHNETERCIVWREDNGVMCRASLDGLSLDGDILSEFKTEGETAHPERWQWKARKLGYVFKAAFYCRGLSKLRISHSPTTRFFVAETTPPYLMSLVRIDDEVMAKEHERVLAAIKLWGRCLAQDRWPGYSLEGYDLTLTEREHMAEQHAPGNSHLSSDDIAATL